VAIYELMIVNSAIKSIIKSGDMTQIHNAMLAGREHGMVRMEEYAYQLEEEGVVSEESFANFFREE
jgi:Tfp pilus assembly pilus retraction ATPase PilT